MKIALVGATGLVGSVMIKVLEERQLPVTEFIPVASSRSVGRKISLNGKSYEIVSVEDAVSMKPDIALFSAGGNTSLEWAPKFAEAGTFVIDNSSAWRMDPGKKLIVPEINASLLTRDDKIIANPNCSTIQMVAVIHSLHKRYRIRRLVVSTYQSVTGTGAKAVAQYDAERNGEEVPGEDRAYHHQIFQNCIPHCDVFLDNDYTREEMKMVNETRKILGDDSIRITATAVRVPVKGGHSESINIEFEEPYDIEDVRNILAATEGVVVQDNPQNFEYPMPLTGSGRDEVFVGRIRRDDTIDNGLNLWIVADNLRKGAATNTIQIAEYLIKNKLV